MVLVSGAPGEIRTPDPLLRRQTLYPTELRAPQLILRDFDPDRASNSLFVYYIPNAFRARHPA